MNKGGSNKDEQSQVENKKEKRNRKIKIIAAVLLIFLVIFAAFFFANRITAIEIEGNEYYTDDEIKDLIIKEPLDNNAWYLYWKYKYTSGEKIPFIDTIEVDVVSMGKIKITVYEKGIVRNGLITLTIICTL